MTAKTRAELEAQFTDQPYGSGGRKQYRQVDNGDLKDLLDSIPLATEGAAADFSAVAEDIIPDENNLYNLGSAAKAWKELWVTDFIATGDENPDSHVAESGTIRLDYAATIRMRNVDDTGDLPIVGIDSQNKVLFGEAVEVDLDNNIMRFVVANIIANGNLKPVSDDTKSLGAAGFTWSDIFATLPTANPNVAGQFWSDGGTVKVSAG